MSVATSDLVESAVLQGFQEGISTGLGFVPVAGPFLQLFFGHIWDMALADRTAAQKQAAMDSLFESVGKMINKALSQSVADQASAYNASIAQLGQDYRVSVQSYKENATAVAVQKVVVRFENCKSTLVHMLNLFAQSSYVKHTVLSYGSALALYVGLLREMMLAGKDCGYSKSEITDFQTDVNERLEAAYTKVFMNNRAALHVYTNVDADLQLATFTVEDTMNIKLRVYYLIDYDDYDSSYVDVTVVTSNTTVSMMLHFA